MEKCDNVKHLLAGGPVGRIFISDFWCSVRQAYPFLEKEVMTAVIAFAATYLSKPRFLCLVTISQPLGC